MKITGVSIIIPTYNSGKILRQCIFSIIKHTDNIKHEIIIIDDASEDNSTFFLKKKKIKNLSLYSMKKNRGVGFCRNFGAKKSKYNYLIYVDADLIIKKNSIKELFYSFKKNLNVGSVGAIPNLKNLNKNDFSSNLVFLRSVFGIYNLRKDSISSNIQSEFCLINKNYLFSLGGWKAYKKSGGEEFELGYKIENSGKKNILSSKAKYETYYADIFTRFKKMVRRTAIYLPILIGKKSFETEGSSATKSYALSGILSNIFMLFIFVSIISSSKIFLNLSILTLIVQIFLERKFLLFVWKVKRLYVLFSVVGLQILNLSMMFGFIVFISRFLGRLFKNM
tara:strand:+ start:2412 stop:3422 length:1011 start_codon:yes stop_codon:yes gene_type:complete